MDQLLFQQIKNELINGSVKKGHPFKYFTLGTTWEESPMQRTVVLRKVLPNLNLIFYTDQRSFKVRQIQKNAKVSALFYHPKKMVQLQLTGEAHLIKNPELLNSVWKTIPERAKRDYSTALPPGNTTDNTEIEYLNDNHYFSMVEIRPTRLEYLKLGRPQHLRAAYTKYEEEWKGTFLVP